MSKLDFIQPLKNYVEKTVKEFLDHYELADKFPDIQQNADKALKDSGVSAHFDAYTNGVVDVVVSETGKSKDEAMDAFSKYYYSGKFE